MTTDKRELSTTSIVGGPSLHSVLTSLSVALPPPDSGGRDNDLPFGFPLSFCFKMEPRNRWRGDGSGVIKTEVVITGVENIEYNYSDYVLSGYFKRNSRMFLCNIFELPHYIKKDLNYDLSGWLTFRAKYNVHTRKGEIIIEYSDKSPWFVNRDIKRFD